MVCGDIGDDRRDLTQNRQCVLERVFNHSQKELDAEVHTSIRLRHERDCRDEELSTRIPLSSRFPFSSRFPSPSRFPVLRPIPHSPFPVPRSPFPAPRSPFPAPPADWRVAVRRETLGDPGQVGREASQQKVHEPCVDAEERMAFRSREGVCADER